jgi:hypothetical protein
MCPDFQKRIEKFSQRKRKEVQVRMEYPRLVKRGKGNNCLKYPHIE